MSSYDDKETSVQDSRPAMLVAFRQGASSWYYCTGSVPVVYDSNTYLATPMLLGNIVSDGDIPRSTLEVKLPISNPFAALFLAHTPDVVTTVTVLRTHYDDSEVRTMWKGRILSFSIAKGVVSFTCEPVFSSLKRLGLRATYQRLCWRTLGGPGCNVNLASYSHAYTVTGLTGAKVTFSTALAEDYLGGTLLASDGTRRMIVDTGSDYVVLMRPSQALVDDLAETPAGVSVTLYQGCDRSTKMCAERFGNIGNHGGFPGIPWINPMTNVSSVF